MAGGKTYGVGAGREKQAGKPIMEAYRKVAERKVGAERNWQAEKPTTWAQEEKKSRKTCGKGDRNADNAVGLFMRDLSVFSESTQVLQFKLKGSLFVFDRSFVIDCLLL